MLEPTLSIHLYEHYQMTVTKRGMFFMLIGIAGTCTAPLAGPLAEWTSRKLHVTAGLFLAAGSTLGMALATGDSFACVTAVFLGGSLSAVSIPALPAMLWDIPADSELTDGEVAATTNSLGAVAAVIGPIAGAGLAEAASFKWMCLSLVLLLVAFGLVQIISYATGAEWRNPPKHTEADEDLFAASKPILHTDEAAATTSFAK